MKNIIKLSLLLGLTSVFPMQADGVKGNAEAGKGKIVACAACHGPDGTGVNADWPRLAGQGAKYLFSQLVSYQSGARKDPVMAGQVAALNEQDMADIAAYFASVEPKYDTAGSAASEEVTLDLLAHGEKLFRGGDIKRGITACAACHGPAGRGIEPASYPALSGQYAKYTTVQLNKFRDAANADVQASTAKIDAAAYRNNIMMQAIAAKLTDKDIEALANYIQGLQP